MKTKKNSRRISPSVFVGSSVESLDVAYAIQDNLQHDAEVTVWPQGIFELSRSAIQSLTNALNRSDFGIFVFTPDDLIRLRKKAAMSVRDNVIFELGLFIGHLGISRTFIVQPDDKKPLHIPTDLTGVTPGKYNPNRRDANLPAALGSFCNQVRNAMKKGGLMRIGKARHTPTARIRNVTIHSALYGSGVNRIDVKKVILKELSKHGSVFIGNQLAGDPCPNVVKDLQLDFTYRGKREQVSLPETSSLTFPQ